MNSFNSLFLRSAFAAVLTGGLLASTSEAATIFTDADGADSHIETVGNWDNGLPDNVGNGGTVSTGSAATTLGNDAMDAMDITFEGSASLAAAAGLKYNGGTLSFQDTSTLTNTGTLAIGRDVLGGVATINVSDSAVLTITNDLKVGFKEDGTLNMSGGTLNVSVDLDLGGNLGGGGDNDGVGTFNLSGGVANFGNKGNWDLGAIGSTVNYTVGSTGIMTFGNGGADYTADLEAAITAGDIVVGGSSAAISAFSITFDGSTTSIQLAAIPEPASMMLALFGVCLTCAVRTKS